jgi:hypothetical protein
MKTLLLLLLPILSLKGYSQKWCFIKTDFSFEISGIYSSNMEGTFFNIRIQGASNFSINPKDGIKLSLENDSSLILNNGTSKFGSFGTEVSWLIPEDKVSLLKSSRLKRIKFSIPVVVGVMDLNIPKSERTCIQSSLQ